MSKQAELLTNITDIKMCKFISEELTYIDKTTSYDIGIFIRMLINDMQQGKKLTRADFRELLQAYCQANSKIKKNAVSISFNQPQGATSC